MKATLKQLAVKVWNGLFKCIGVLLVLFFLAGSFIIFRDVPYWLECAEKAEASADDRTQFLHRIQGYHLGKDGPLLNYLVEKTIEDQTESVTRYRQYARDDLVNGTVWLAMAFVIFVIAVIVRVRQTSQDPSD